MGASNSTPSKKPVVIVIGGGYTGTTVARLLDKSNDFFVLLIEKKDYFFHNIAALRALVEPSFTSQIAIPYDKLLVNGLTIQGYVTDINPQDQTVSIQGRNKALHYDYLVVATGSEYPYPGSSLSKSIKDVTKEYAEGHSLLSNSKKIVIVGGGPVGVELAGEIGTDFPSKSVTLIHRGDFLGNSEFNSKTISSVESQLRSLRVNIILKESVEITPELRENFKYGIAAGERQIHTSGGKSIDTDLVIFCTGGQPSSNAYATSLAQSVKNNRLVVDEYLAVKNFTNIYAVGDCADIETKQAYHGGLQATQLAKNIQAIARHKKPRAYTPKKGVMMLLSIGRNGGAGQAGTMTFSKWFSATLKSKTMLVGQIQGGLNYKAGSRTRDITDTQKANARLSLDTSDADVNELIRGY